MIIEERKFLLKNETEAYLRTPDKKDAANVLDCILSASSETDFLLKYPEEYISSVPVEEVFILENRDSEDTLMLICEVNGEVAALCDIRFFTSKKTCHRAEISIVVRKKYWGLGIGSEMIGALLDTAALHEKTEIVELEMFDGNDRARALYEKFGFFAVSIKPNVFKLKDGSYCDLVYMQKRIR